MGGRWGVAAHFRINITGQACNVIEKGQPMRVLLRHKRTGFYSGGSIGWVDSTSQALDFSSVPKATRFALDENLSAAEIVLKSDVLPDEVVMPVLSEWSGLGSQPEAPLSSRGAGGLG